MLKDYLGTYAMNHQHHPDLEDQLASILQEEIWKEITAETGETKADLDRSIIEQLIKLHAKNE